MAEGNQIALEDFSEREFNRHLRNAVFVPGGTVLDGIRAVRSGEWSQLTGEEKFDVCLKSAVLESYKVAGYLIASTAVYATIIEPVINKF